MASFLAKTVRDRLRMIQKKKNVIVPIHSNPTRKREFQKNSKKIQEIKKKKSLWPLFKPKRDGTGWEWEKKKLSFRSIPTKTGIGNSKKRAKNFKKLKNIVMASFQAKLGRDRLIKKKKKKKLSFWSILTRPGIVNSNKIKKKMQKIKKYSYGFISSENGKGQVESDFKKKKVIVPIHSNKIWN